MNTTIDADELFKLKAFNSHQVLLNRFRSFSTGDYIPTKNHLNNFSWVYYLELRIIAAIMRGTAPIVIHDVATNMGSFPCLINALKEDELFGLRFSRIECSDVNVDTVKRSIGDISLNGKVNHDNILVKYLDLLEANSLLDAADVITANDVLEHFPEDISRAVFRNLWAAELDNCKNLTTQYRHILKLCPHPMGDEGYLFLIKTYEETD